MPARATTAQSRSFDSNPPAFHVCNSLKLSTEIAHVHSCESHARSSIAIEFWYLMSDLRSQINFLISEFDFFFPW